jgi:hypothetical protein
MAVSKVSELPGLVTVASGTQFLAVDSGATYNTTASNVAAYAKSVNLPSVTSTLNTASPNDTNNVSGVTASGGTTNQFLALVPKGTGGVVGSIPDSSSAGGNVRGSYSVDLQLTRAAANQVASGTDSGLFAGKNNKADATDSVVVGGSTNQASGLQTAVVGGSNNYVIGTYSAAIGGNYGYDRNLSAALCFGAYGSTSYGYNQERKVVLMATTANATSTALTVNNAAAGTLNQVNLDNNTAFGFRAEIMATVQTGAGNGKYFTVIGAIKRGAGMATTVLIGSPTITVNAADAGASAWTVAATADTSNGCLQINATGQASTNIRWTAVVYTFECFAG